MGGQIFFLHLIGDKYQLTAGLFSASLDMTFSLDFSSRPWTLWLQHSGEKIMRCSLDSLMRFYPRTHGRLARQISLQGSKGSDAGACARARARDYPLEH